jgi:hypothetical protein
MALSAPKGSFQELLSTVVDTVNGWLTTSLGSLIHGEDQGKDVLGTITKPVASACPGSFFIRGVGVASGTGEAA